MNIVDYLSEDINNIGYKYFNKKTGENIDSLDFKNQYGVNILTLHSSKGLQFDTVIIPFNDGELNYERSDQVLYVAMTRAKTKLFILYAKELATCFLNCKDSNKYIGEITISRMVLFDELTGEFKFDND